MPHDVGQAASRGANRSCSQASTLALIGHNQTFQRILESGIDTFLKQQKRFVQGQRGNMDFAVAKGLNHV